MPSITGRLEMLPLTSSVFGNTRTIRVWLPPGYVDAANTERHYPVLFMLDGRSLFDTCAATGPEWQIDETLTRMISGRVIEPVIVVGIDAAPGANRALEYLPYKDNVFFPSSEEPFGKRFPDFLATEVLPFVAERYRIGKPPYGIGGSSYGAVAALYALLARPDLFDLGLLESPSLQVGNGQLLRDTEHLHKGPRRISLGVGTTEFGGSPDDANNRGLVRAVEQLKANLESAVVSPPAVRIVIQPLGSHDVKSWASRFEGAARFLYGAK